MDTRILVDEDIESGKELLEFLDGKKLDIKIAMWFLDTEIGRWYLILSTPLVDEKGPRKVYLKLIKNLDGFETSIKIDNIKLLTYNSPFANIFKGIFNTGKGISQIRFQENVINGLLIKDAVIYRVS